jgi:2-polyprenyl-3-methyl-5-hydroxy-6-metoxy-1,4-benzoquinol methylase
MRRVDLEGLDPQLPLPQVPTFLSQKGRTLAVALDTYVHRYAPMYEQPRPDLQAWVPREAERILDIGCAAGVFGAALKARQACHVVGIEVNSLLVEAAAKRLNRVIQADVEVIPPATLTAEFDCVVCGDVLEHLRDPWSVVAKLAVWLRPGGRLIATLPNVGHWAIVADLLQGRWDLVPFGLLCWGHLRFFTRSGVERLFAGHGLTLELLQGLTEEPSPAQEAFLQKAVALLPNVDRESLRTNEFLVVARKPGG